MSLPIKNTPILKGKASKRFNRLLEADKNNKDSDIEKKEFLNLSKK